MAFDYRQFLAENKLTKVSKGQETGKAKILSEGIQIREGFDTEIDDLEEGHKCPECGQDPCVCEKTPKTQEDVDLFMEKVQNQFSPRIAGELAAYAATMTPEDFFDIVSKKYFWVQDNLNEVNKQKEDYLKRKEREEKGNWSGSVGAFVEKHGEDIAKLKTFKDIDEYINWTMAPEISDEAYNYVLNLRQNSKSPYKFIMALYNATLKGSGLGMNEASTCNECDDWDETEEVAWEDYGDEYPVDLQEMALNHSSLGGERHRKKPGVKPGTANQDKMAKSEMKGDEIEVTIGGVKKAVSQRAFNKYRKMTDPEEKKAWKKKYGFIK